MSQIDDRDLLEKILKNALITPYFQPIYNLNNGEIYGHEALSRGPMNSPLFSPDPLFTLAQKEEKLHKLELLCREKALSKFAKLSLKGRLFLNVSASLLASPDHQSGMTLAILKELGLDQKDIVIELSEQHPYDHNGLSRNSVEHYRKMGFQVAIDDLGVGYSGLQLWSELQPDIVKIDKHFITGVDKDEIKREFVRSIVTIAQRLNCTLIAEGIETQQELDQLIAIGVTLGQGYFLGRPTEHPAFSTHPYLVKQAKRRSQFQIDHSETVQTLCRPTPSLLENDLLEDAAQYFRKQPDLIAIPILNPHGEPLGVVRRNQLHELFSTPYGRALYEHKPVINLLSDDVLIVESNVGLSNVSTLMTDQESDTINNEIIIVREGKFIGTGHLRDLLKRITELKIQNATYSNPLTLLPGNVPIHWEVSRRLLAKEDFYVAYFDLNDFKPFNDFFGYSKGDAVIQLVGALIKEWVAPDNNFIGHIGGDDFVVIFGSPDWQHQCDMILQTFAQKIRAFYSDDTLAEGGVWTKSRHGEMRFHPILSLAIGVVHPDPEQSNNHHQVAEMAAHAKNSAKQQGGNIVYFQPTHPPVDIDKLHTRPHHSA
ncbi:GGDEF domain-containing protein [Marinomonas sp. M1K-6]|uniref:GGDEF domain-containing protein n=1 Tax=Marinomonas profundi TaxID=2726122 RepID=A0A847R1C4_9GAMM|nr:GGDEF domain-containing protein [Marinomonas profundi]NLQ17472.1 GGDEF domain-containing protein [Marinomonas profundi]UDV01994.1 GGDEF domain-containing protein [Marinomonas profundi]